MNSEKFYQIPTSGRNSSILHKKGLDKMAIERVNEIPKPTKKRSLTVRDMLEKDIENAMKQNINKFKFTGDYNFKYLPNTAKTVAKNISEKAVNEQTRPLFDRLEKNLPEDRNFQFRFSGFTASNFPFFEMRPYIEITAVKNQKNPDIYDVYCEISEENLQYNVKEIQARMYEKYEKLTHG